MSAALPMPQHEPPDELSEQLEDLIVRVTKVVENELRAGVRAMFRFANLEDIEATCRLLDERGEPMYLEEIIRELKRGGLWRGPSGSRGGPDADMKRSISRFASRNDGKGDRIKYFGENLIGKCEWKEGEFPGPKKNCSS